MALLGHMLTVGYGCSPCHEEANHWFEEASKRLGYHPLEAGGQLLGTTAGPPAPSARHEQPDEQQQLDQGQQQLQRLQQQQGHLPQQRAQQHQGADASHVGQQQ